MPESSYGSLRCFMCEWGMTAVDVGLVTRRNDIIEHLEGCIGPVLRLNVTRTAVTVFDYPDISEEGWGEMDGHDLIVDRTEYNGIFSYREELKKKTVSCWRED